MEGVRRIGLMTFLEKVYETCVRDSLSLGDLIPKPHPLELPKRVLKEEMMEALGRILQEEEIEKLRTELVPAIFADEHFINNVVSHNMRKLREGILKNPPPDFIGWKHIWQMLFIPIAAGTFHCFFGPPASAITISFLVPKDPHQREMLLEAIKLWQKILEEIDERGEPE